MLPATVAYAAPSLSELHRELLEMARSDRELDDAVQETIDRMVVALGATWSVWVPTGGEGPLRLPAVYDMDVVAFERFQEKVRELERPVCRGDLGFALAAMPICAGDRCLGILTLFHSGRLEHFIRQAEVMEWLFEVARLALGFLAIHAQRGSVLKRIRRYAADGVDSAEARLRQVSRELHDGIGQELALVLVRIEIARRQIATGNASEAFDQLEKLVEKCCARVRELSHGLRPELLDAAGLFDTARNLFEEFLGADHALVFELPSVEPCLTENVKIHVYRCLQECARNIRRHAKARTVLVRIAMDDGLLVEVRDDGEGAPEPSGRLAGIGLLGMEERMFLVGGRIEVHSPPGGGFAVILRLPMAGLS